MHTATLAISLLTLGILAPIAHADSDPTTGTAAAAEPRTDTPTSSHEVDRRDRSSLTAMVGINTPTGSVGFEYARAVHTNVEIAAGAGLGYVFLSALGDDYRVAPQVAIMPRLRARRGPVRLSAGAGISAGEDQQGFSPFASSEGVDRRLAVWLNTEGAVQVISRVGWFARFTVGGTYMIDHGRTESSDPNRSPMTHDEGWLPYLGLGFGRTL
jgi:hypothetical protein